jgi:hypothetical protein
MQEEPQEIVNELNDYLYVDRARIAAYHTQLLGSGVPLQSKFTESFVESAGKSGEAGFPKVFSATMSGGKSSEYSAERSFDQTWPMALATIAELDDHGFIHEGALAVPVGSIVRVHGALQTVDLRLLKDLWTPMTRMMGQQQNKTKTKTGSPEIKPAQIADLAKVLPHPIVAQVVTSSAPEGEPFIVGEKSLNAWGFLNPEHIVGDATTFALMNGGFHVGDYTMVAILDVGSAPDAPTFDFSAINPTNTFEMALAIQQLLRTSFGRPNYANGVTPLLVYRSLKRTVPTLTGSTVVPH